MRMYDSEERSRRRSLNLEMLALVEKHLEGSVTRVELEVWARAHRGPFSTGIAESLHTCLYNLGDMHEDGPLVRRVDLVEHVRASRQGEVPIDERNVAEIPLSLAEVCERARTTSTRFCLEGIGWFEITQVASLLTARTFVIGTELAVNIRRYVGCFVRTHAFPDSAEERAYVLSDLSETLGIDPSLCIALG
jgi:hypothetical protein